MIPEFFNFNNLALWGLTITVIFSLLGIWFNIITIRHNKDMLFNDLVKTFFDIERQLEEHIKKKRIKTWDTRIFNSLEYLSYHANRSSVIYKHTRDFMRNVIIGYREKVLKKFYLEQHKNKLEEWKTLYNKLKKGERDIRKVILTIIILLIGIVAFIGLALGNIILMWLGVGVEIGMIIVLFINRK